VTAGGPGPRPVMCVVGARPNFMKMAPILRALQAHAPPIPALLLHTGQHYDADMSDRLFRDLALPRPDINLEVGSASHAVQTAEVMRRFEPVLDEHRPSCVVVVGDVNSTLACSLVAAKKDVPVAHVEAGLRTHNLERPFPEEGLRQMISRITAMHFAPTERARAALLREGIEPEKILLTGNTVVDAQQWIVRKHGIRREGLPENGHILVTSHRREHWGEEMENTFRAIGDIAREHPSCRILFPVHLNPVVQKAARGILQGVSNVKLLAPLDYLDMQQALADASLLLTDSGGLQEEAPTFGVPCLVLRRETERPEAVEAGCARLIGPEREAIVAAVNRLLDHPAEANAMRRISNPFGDGLAARRIAQAVAARLAPPSFAEQQPMLLAA
jgi:UDP-N-acetylglucosamine 2-epimerase (non-hydrolysing)